MTRQQRVMAQRRFLEAFRAIGVVSRAAILARVARRTFYNWRKNDPIFGESFEAAQEDMRDEIRSEIFERAIVGWDEPVYQGGRQVGVVRRKSDAILLKMAAARLPEYRALGPHQKAAAEAGGESRIIVEIIEADDWRSVQRVVS